METQLERTTSNEQRILQNQQCIQELQRDLSQIKKLYNGNPETKSKPLVSYTHILLVGVAIISFLIGRVTS